MILLSPEDIAGVDKALQFMKNSNKPWHKAGAYLFFDDHKKKYLHLIEVLIKNDIIRVSPAQNDLIQLSPNGSIIAQATFTEYYSLWAGKVKQDVKVAQAAAEKTLNEAELVKLTLTDYPKTKRNATVSLWLGVVGILLAVAAFIVSLIK